MRAYQQSASTRGDIAVALRDADTALFHAGAMRSADLLAGTSRTIYPVRSEQPYDALFGVELMRFAALALRAIARKSGEPSALSHAARVRIGRLALWLTRLVAPAHFDAYVDRWAKTTGARRAGLTRQDLADGLADPWFEHDVGDALVVKSETLRRFVPIAAASVFDPWLWNRQAPADHWQAGRDIAIGAAHPRDDDGLAKRTLLETVTLLGTDLPAPFAARGTLVTEAIRIANMVGPHGTPLATDPKLLSLSMAGAAAPAAGTKPKLKFVELGRRKLASIAKRARMSRSQHRRPARSGAERRHDNDA